MKKVLPILIAVIAILFTSCDGAVSPRTLNETLVKSYDRAGKSFQSFDEKITEGVKSKDYASIAVAADSTLALLNAEIATIEAMKAPSEGESYKNSILEIHKALKNAVESGKKFSTLKEGYTSKEFNAMEKEHSAIMKAYSSKYEQMSKAQAEFAKAVGAKLR